MKQTVNEEPNVYSVDNIVGRRVRRGRVEYRVRWKGFTPDQDSWEPFTSLREPCLPLIHDFHIRHRKLYQKKKRFSHPFVAYSKPPGRASNELLDISMQFEKDSDDLTADKSSISSTKSQPPPRSFKKVMESIAIEPASRRSAPSSIDLHSPNSYLSHSTVDPSHSPSLLNSEPDVPHLPLVSDSTTSSNTLTSNCSSNIVNSDTNWLPCTVSDSSSTELSNSGLSRFKIGRKVARDKVFIPKRSRDDFVNTPPPLQKANSLTVS
ncbi:unnamed protein product [Heterobilharzia americana]|nr:unnamed protein product [Heterobilharzia americana]